MSRYPKFITGFTNRIYFPPTITEAQICNVASTHAHIHKIVMCVINEGDFIRAGTHTFRKRKNSLLKYSQKLCLKKSHYFERNFSFKKSRSKNCIVKKMCKWQLIIRTDSTYTLQM